MALHGRFTRRIAPKLNNSGLYVASTGTANSVTTVVVPEGAIAVRLWMENGSGTRVRFRIGFAGEVNTPATADTDTTLGHHEDAVLSYDLPAWARVMHLASNTANAKVFGTWYYD
jgi:hypothetical protein